MIILSDNKKAYTVEEAAEKIGRSVYTVRQYMTKGKLKAQIIGKKYYTTDQAIEEFKKGSF